jgi:hypothetical protein
MKGVIEFISRPSYDEFEEHFNTSMGIIFQEVDQLPNSDFPLLDNPLLVQILTYPHLLVDSEDMIFNFVTSIVQQDPERKSLLEVISYPPASLFLLSNFFQNLSLQGIEPNVFNHQTKTFF